MNKLYLAFIAAVSLFLFLSEYHYKTKYDKAAKELEIISAKSKELEQKIKDENERFKQRQIEFERQLEASDKKRIADLDNARSSFIAERLRLQSDYKDGREENASLSASLKNCTGNRSEAERLLLRTLDESETINAAYSSCREILLNK